MDEELFERCLWSAGSLRPDLVIRTSGEIRLSDFLLWQSSYSVIAFQHVLWPDFTIWDLFKAVFYYQRHSNDVLAAHDAYLKRLSQEKDRRIMSRSQSDQLHHEERIDRFLTKLDEKRVQELQDQLSSGSPNSLDDSNHWKEHSNSWQKAASIKWPRDHVF